MALFNSKWSNTKLYLRGFIENPKVNVCIIALIIINAIVLGLETSQVLMSSIGYYLLLIDQLILAIFVIELVIRMFAYGYSFWRDPWSLFDFVVVVIALVPASGPLAVLRALRVLRVLRLLTAVPSMRRVVGALLAAVPGLGSIGLVLLIIYYVFAVIATNLFAESHPEWFGTMARSFYTLFQIMTLESWSMGISRPVMEEFPYAWAFFVPFILVATFTMLNLFIAIIVNAMQTYSDTEHQTTREVLSDSQIASEAELHRQIQNLNEEIKALKTVVLSLRSSLQSKG